MKKTLKLGKTLIIQGLMAIVALSFGAQDALADKNKVKRNSVVGCWKTIDDKTKKQKSVVKIWLNKAGHVTGRILSLASGKKPKCTKCTGANKNKPIIGIKMIWGMKPNTWWWKGGKILDPASGKIYKCELWTKKGNPNKLKVRGFVAFFYRTQTWLKTSCPAKK